MVVFPHCKINIGLRIHERRPDGYHNLSTVFYPLPLTDVLEAVPATETVFEATGLPVPGSPDDNLCMRAYRMLLEDHTLPPLRVHLHKVIPTGAGLGGGSSDGAFMLRLLRKAFQLDIPDERLRAYANRLGSDCAFFLQDSPCYADGRGDELYPLTHGGLDHYRVVLVCPALQVSTAWAYSRIMPRTPPRSLMGLIREPVAQWRETIGNDFEAVVMDQFPVLAGIKELLYRQGALFSSLSGTGSAVYGIFREGAEPAELDIPGATVFRLPATLPQRG